MEEFRQWFNLVANTGGNIGLALLMWWLLREQTQQFVKQLNNQWENYVVMFQALQEIRNTQHQENQRALRRIERAIRGGQRPKPKGEGT